MEGDNMKQYALYDIECILNMLESSLESMLKCYDDVEQPTELMECMIISIQDDVEYFKNERFKIYQTTWTNFKWGGELNKYYESLKEDMQTNISVRSLMLGIMTGITIGYLTSGCTLRGMYCGVIVALLWAVTIPDYSMVVAYKKFKDHWGCGMHNTTKKYIKRRFTQLMNQCGITIEDLQTALNELMEENKWSGDVTVSEEYTQFLQCMTEVA